MSGGALPPILYRVVHSAAPNERDFDSAMVKGTRLSRLYRASPELWAGISTYDRAVLAEGTSRSYPHFGEWIAELDVTLLLETKMILIRQTGASGHHYTLWGQPQQFIGAIGRVWRA